VEWKKVKVTISGKVFYNSYIYRTNRQGELVILEASVLSLPRNFLEVWVRQLEQNQPPYYKRHLVYKEIAPIGLQLKLRD
jgi:hypothetical protein